MTDINPEVLLVFTRARQRAITARADAARAKLGGETAARPSRRSDRQAAERIIGIWKRHIRSRSRGTSTINLPSGKKIVFDHAKGEVVK